MLSRRGRARVDREDHRQQRLGDPLEGVQQRAEAIGVHIAGAMNRRQAIATGRQIQPVEYRRVTAGTSHVVPCRVVHHVARKAGIIGEVLGGEIVHRRGGGAQQQV